MKTLMISVFCFFSSLCHAQCENSNLFDDSFFNKHLLLEKDTLYYIGTSLYLPYKDIDKELFSRLSNQKNSNKTICIEAIIIQGYEKLNNRPFFLIDRVWLE